MSEATLIAALERVQHILTIPAAEYVPAIPDAWAVIDAALSSEARSRSQDGKGPVRALSEQDELSLALARQRELETERDEERERAERWSNIACERAEKMGDLFERANAAETRQRELEEALRPFARLSDAFPGVVVVEVCRPHSGNPSPRIEPLEMKHFRKAAALLSPPTQNGAPGRPVPPHGSGP